MNTWCFSQMIMINKNLSDRRQLATPRGMATMCDIYVDYAKNAELWDVDGNRYIDFATGTSTMIVGHGHPKVLEAIHKQVDKFTHTFFQQIQYESYVTLCERLNAIVPCTHEKRTALFTDGAGAVENAIKIAKAYTNRSGIISFHGAYHGRTYLTTSIGGKSEPYKTYLGAPAPEVYQLPFDDSYETEQALYNLFKYTVKPDKIAAIIVEPVQGEAGFRVAREGLMQTIRNVCDKHGIVFITDEVQSGFGRTGKMFAMDYSRTRSDLTVMSKAIGAGIPLSAVTGDVRIMNAMEPGGLGGTYNGNPIACAAAHAVLDIIEEENLLRRSLELGEYLHSSLQKLTHGIGSMRAIRFDSTEEMRAVQKKARDNGLILTGCGIDTNVLRFLYPLTIEMNVLDEAIDIFKDALDV